MEDPDPYLLLNGGQTRHASGPVQTPIRYMYYKPFVISGILMFPVIVSVYQILIEKMSACNHSQSRKITQSLNDSLV